MFIFLAFTDVLDGIVARAYGHITQFGKVIDPLADKVLMFFGLITVTFLMEEKAEDVLFFTVLLRDITLIIGSLLLMPKGFKPEPAIWGKLATTFQALSVTLYMAKNVYKNVIFMEPVLIGAVLFTVISWIYYIMKGIEFILSERGK